MRIPETTRHQARREEVVDEVDGHQADRIQDVIGQHLTD
jgi:hypothetical protein